MRPHDARWSCTRKNQPDITLAQWETEKQSIPPHLVQRRSCGLYRAAAMSHFSPLPAGCRQPLCDSRFSSVPDFTRLASPRNTGRSHKVRLKKEPGLQGAAALAQCFKSQVYASLLSRSRGDGCDFQHRRKGREPREPRATFCLLVLDKMICPKLDTVVACQR